MAEIDTNLYEIVNYRIDIIKYLYLKTVNDYEIDDNVKSSMYSRLISLSKEFYFHNDKIIKMDINQSNFDSFSKSESKYAKKLERELKSVIDELLKVQSVKIKIKKINTEKIDSILSTDVIHKEYFINNEVINHLNSFKEAAVETDRDINSEMIKLKAEKYSSDLKMYSSKNIELLYRLIMRMENLISEDKVYVMHEDTDNQIFREKINFYFNNDSISFYLKEKNFKCSFVLYEGEHSSLVGKMTTIKKELPVEIYNIDGRTANEFIEKTGLNKIYEKMQDLRIELESEGKDDTFTKDDAIELIDELL